MHAGTPPFFSPELSTANASDTYDNRVVDLWAVGVTLYLWVSGRLPFEAPTTMLLLQAISEAPVMTPAPPEVNEIGLRHVIEGLLRRDPATRLTLAQLRLDPWMCDHDRQPLPPQPEPNIEVSPEETAQAITSREGIRVGSASGASALGAALALCGAGDATLGWMRIGTNTIRKRSNTAEANFYRSIAASGHLAPHLPVIYSISNLPREEVHILMGDLVTGMRHPCAMSFLMGVRTVTHADLDPTHGTPHVALCDSMRSMAPEYAAQMLSPGEARSGAVPVHRYLEFLDSISTSRSLGFRIDAAKTMVDGTLDPLRSAVATTLSTASDKTQSAQAISAFLQRDERLAASTLLKLRTLKKALSRSSFFGRHAFVRSTMLLVFDDAHRDKGVELKIMNFGSSYALPEGVSVTHTEPWAGTAACHEDGYLTGVHSLLRIVQTVCETLATPLETAPMTATLAADKARATLLEQDDIVSTSDTGGWSSAQVDAVSPRQPPPPRRGLQRR